MVYMELTHADGWRDFSACGREYAAAIKANDKMALERLDKIFFGQQGRPAKVPKFSKICGDCPVRMLCLEDGVVHNYEGIWGGMTQTDRGWLRLTIGNQLVLRALEEGWLDRDSVSVMFRAVVAEQDRAQSPVAESSVPEKAAEMPLQFELQMVEDFVLFQAG